MSSRWRVRVVEDHSHGPLLGAFLRKERLPCSLALSRGSSASNTARLEATLQWLAPRSSSLLVVEGSFLHRWDRIALDAISERAAREEARREAEKTARRIERCLDGVSGLTAGRLLRWDEILERDSFAALAASVERYARGDGLFDRLLEDEAAGYLGRSRGVGPEGLAPGARAALRSYVVEEVSVLLWLQGEGLPVEAYHGADIPILEAIGRGRFPAAPFACPRRTHVGLALEAPSST